MGGGGLRISCGWEEREGRIDWDGSDVIGGEEEEGIVGEREGATGEDGRFAGKGKEVSEVG
jgi:hypothetical protein